MTFQCPTRIISDRREKIKIIASGVAAPFGADNPEICKSIH